MKYETPFDLPLDDYEGLIERNEYWDDSGDEANWLTMDQKLIRLAGFVQKVGDYFGQIATFLHKSGKPNKFLVHSQPVRFIT